MPTTDQDGRGLTRRKLLQSAGAAAGGVTVGSLLGVANAEAARVIPRRRLAPTEVTLMTIPDEFAGDKEGFEARHPNISVKIVPDDPARLAAMFAAGDPPDLFRVQAPGIPQYIARRMIRPLTDYFRQSDLVRPADLAPASNYYKWDGKRIGSGDIYGMVKDWSPDFTIYAYTQAFKDAKVDLPDWRDKRRLRWSELREIAEKLSARKRGGRPIYRGLVHSNGLTWFDRVIMNLLVERGKSLYTSDFGRMNLTKNPDAVKLFRFFYEIHKKKLDINPRAPSVSWDGQEFVEGKVGMVQYGYWFSAMAESPKTKGKIVLLKAPTWVGVGRDPTMTATGWVMAARSKNPDQAWELFEYFMGAKPARDRAASGWGVPALKSLYDRMPRQTAFQRQVQAVLQQEIALDTKPLRFNPYLGEQAVSSTYQKHLASALTGKISFNELLKRVEREVNQLIKEGKSRL
jgi:multiple sugar transport system substrate-binding protein